METGALHVGKTQLATAPCDQLSIELLLMTLCKIQY